MKWFYPVVLVCFSLFHSLHADLEIGFEEKLNKLEIENGIKSRPETTSFNVFGDFLYWKASLDGVAWATTAEVVPGVGGGTVFDKYKTRTVHFDYSPAFQVGVGIGLPYDHWDLSVCWLRTHSTGKDRASGELTVAIGNRLILDTIGLLQGLLTPPNEATAHSRVHLDVVDFVLGRTFFWSRYFTFRPFAGVRGVWLNLDWDIAFTMPIQPDSAETQSYTFADIDNRFNAAGLVGGFESKWNLYQGFGLFSYATASLIYGDSSEKTKQKFFHVPSFSSTVIEQTFTAENSAHTVKGVFDIAVGLKWAMKFYKDYRILLRVGYDFFYWPEVTQKTIIQSTRIRERADLSFQGLIVGGRLDF